MAVWYFGSSPSFYQCPGFVHFGSDRDILADLGIPCKDLPLNPTFINIPENLDIIKIYVCVHLELIRP